MHPSNTFYDELVGATGRIMLTNRWMRGIERKHPRALPGGVSHCKRSIQNQRYCRPNDTAQASFSSFVSAGARGDVGSVVFTDW